jgi:replicative DNA helicase
MSDNDLGINVVPHSREAEEALIGAALMSPDLIQGIDLDTEDFYIHRNRMVWDALSALSRRGIEPDLVTVTDHLESRGQLSDVGGPAALISLINTTPTALRAGNYAGIIRDKAQRRRAILAASELARAAYDETKDLADSAASVVDNLTMGIRPRNGAVHVRQFIDQVYADTEDAYNNPRKVWGISTGFTDFDTATGGLQPGEVLYIGGEPGVGKSILSMQMGFNMGLAGQPGAIYSLEMLGRQVLRRTLSARSKVATRKLKTGEMSDVDWSDFTAACEAVSEAPIYLCDESNLTTAALRADLARLKARHGITWFVLDYLYLMADGMGKLDPNQRTEVLSARTKNMTKELELVGITVNSVTKDGMDAEAPPSKKNIRGSGQVIHDADLIGFLTNHIPEMGGANNPNMRTFIFAKGREMENPRGAFHLVKFPDYPAFGDFASNAKTVSLNSR